MLDTKSRGNRNTLNHPVATSCKLWKNVVDENLVRPQFITL